MPVHPERGVDCGYDWGYTRRTNPILDESPRRIEPHKRFYPLREVYSSSNIEIPEKFLCAITNEIMNYPVYDSTQKKGEIIHYEREAIEKWISLKGSNPFTRESMSIEMITLDVELKNEIETFKYGQSIRNPMLPGCEDEDVQRYRNVR